MIETPYYLVETIKDALKKHKTPFLLMLKEKIETNYNLIKRAFHNSTVFYAVKANFSPEVVKFLDELGSSFDVSTRGELELVLNLGIKSEKILYTHPVKKIEEIEFARDNGVNLFIFDNEFELEKLKKVAPGSELLLRIAVTNQYCVVDLNFKFGASPDMAESLILKAQDMGFKVRGIAFHIGSQSLNPFTYVDSIITAKKIYELLELRGIHLDILDIGGGFPISYGSTIMPFEKFVEPIVNSLSNFFFGKKIFLEPGRFLVGPAGILITKIIGKAIRNNTKWYYIDDGVYGAFSGQVYDKMSYQFFSLKQDEFMSQCIVAGPTCDSFDVITTRSVLPELEVGDILISPNMGAYTTVSATNFNLYEKPEVVLY